MTNTPLISVIMPVYNGEKYLNQALQSLLQQTFTDFEIIAIDDKSTDNSKETLLNFQKQDSRIKVVENTNEKGLPGALNTGLALAQGMFIARADADDINHLNRFEIQCNFLQKNKDIDIVGAGYHAFGSKIERDIYHPHSSIEIAWRFLTDTYLCHPTVMFRKSILTDVPQYPTMASEDFAFFSLAIQKHRAINISQILLDYRQHDSNYSNYANPKIQQSVYATFLKNYTYYRATTQYAEEYFKYKKERTLELEILIPIITIEFDILNKIRKGYGIQVLTGNFIWLIIKATLQAVTVCTLTQIKKI